MESIENGLNNLKTTYSVDPVTIVTIENIIIKIKEYSLRGKRINTPIPNGSHIGSQIN
jgi:hypothetical protein